jgi:lactoylglutathione lyase
MMPRAQNLFEAHLPVANLDTSVTFFRDVVGLHLAYIEDSRGMAFFWIGRRGTAMLGLWAAGSGPQTMTLHVAFGVSVDDVLAAPEALRSAGVAPLDFDGRPTDAPVVLAWMPAAAVYFRDPDGHLLEYLAMLSEEPRPDRGIVPWRDWSR